MPEVEEDPKVAEIEELEAALTGTLTVLIFAESFCRFASKFTPVIVRAPPGAAMAGEKLEMLGRFPGAVTEKEFVELAVPAGAVTAMAPLVAPAGTVATICVELAESIVACAPLKVTVS